MFQRLFFFNMTSGGLSNLKSMAKAIDAEVEALEKEVFFGLRDVSKSNFSADIADEVLEQVKEMKKDGEGGHLRHFNTSTFKLYIKVR